ncbi:fimbrial-like protein [Shigella sonnei]|nr:fimbrial-like protein [Shigella sonnei]
MKKSVLTAFITVVCATSSVMAADDNAITDGKVTFNGKVIAPACTLVDWPPESPDNQYHLNK